MDIHFFGPEQQRHESELRAEEEIRKGRKRGREEGKREAEHNTKKDIAFRLLQKGLPEEVIAESTGLSTEKILEIKKENQS